MLGRFPSVWCGDRAIPEGSFHLRSRDAVCGSAATVGESAGGSGGGGGGGESDEDEGGCSGCDVGTMGSVGKEVSEGKMGIEGGKGEEGRGASPAERLFASSVVFDVEETKERLLRAGLLVRYHDVAQLLNACDTKLI